MIGRRLAAILLVFSVCSPAAAQPDLASPAASPFADLVAGASIPTAADPSFHGVAGKRVAIILSSGSIKELARLERERQTFMKRNPPPPEPTTAPPPQRNGLFNLGVSTLLTGNPHDDTPREAFDLFVRETEPKGLGRQVAKAITDAGATPVAAEDLSVLSGGQADYALVVDWRYRARFDLTAAKYKREPECPEAGSERCRAQALVFSTADGYLVSPKVEVIRTSHDEWVATKQGEVFENDEPYLWMFRSMREVFGKSAFWSALR